MEAEETTAGATTTAAATTDARDGGTTTTTTLPRRGVNQRDNNNDITPATRRRTARRSSRQPWPFLECARCFPRCVAAFLRARARRGNDQQRPKGDHAALRPCRSNIPTTDDARRAAPMCRGITRPSIKRSSRGSTRLTLVPVVSEFHVRLKRKTRWKV
jgi:hypothetical protein